MSISKQLREYADNMSAQAKPIVDYKTHAPTNRELNNLCYLSMKYIANWPMRAADFHVVNMFGGTPKTVVELDEHYIPQLADYMWDHLMGEPEEPTTEDLEYAIKAIRDVLYSMDEKTRNDVEDKNADSGN